MTDQGQNLQQQQQQAVQNAQEFYGRSIGRIKSQVQNYRSQLEQYAQQVPQGDAQAQIQEMTDSYLELEGSIDQAAQDMDVEDTMNQAAQDTQQQIMQTAQGAAQQVQDTAGQAVGQAQQAAGQAAGGDEEPRVTNAARRKAQELGVDLSTIRGTGSGGLITLNDVVGS